MVYGDISVSIFWGFFFSTQEIIFMSLIFPCCFFWLLMFLALEVEKTRSLKVLPCFTEVGPG